MNLHTLLTKHQIVHGLENDQPNIDAFVEDIKAHIATQKLYTTYETTLYYACMSKWQLLRTNFEHELERMEDELEEQL